jgi:hypothetical protein
MRRCGPTVSVECNCTVTGEERGHILSVLNSGRAFRNPTIPHLLALDGKESLTDNHSLMDPRFEWEWA